MKKILIITSIVIIIAAFGSYYFYKKGRTYVVYQHPNKVLQELKEGNVRFVSGKMHHHNYAKQLLASSVGQHPKAVLLSGMGSRNIPDITFDQTVGDILTLRVAGSVIDRNILASMELATAGDGATLIVVLGHTGSSTVKMACENKQLGNITALVRQIQPAVKTAKAQIDNKSCSNPILINAITRQNIMNMVKLIPQKSPIIADLMKKGRVRIVGGIYNSATGAVIFLKQSTVRVRRVAVKS